MNSDIKKFLIIGGVAAVVMIAGILLMQRSATPATVVTGDTSLVRADSSQTHPEAKVAVVEFGDYECPACAQAAPVVKTVLDSYGDKVNFVFRHFPLTQHYSAMVAAEAAEAAGEQGKYWDMHDWLYANQRTWANQPNDLDIIVEGAKDLGLDIDKFKQSIQDRKFETKIMSDKSNGEALAINATPTFYVNGEQIVGVPKPDELKAKIDQALQE